MIPLGLDVTLVLLGPVILVISLFLRVLLVLMVPRDFVFLLTPLDLVVPLVHMIPLDLIFLLVLVIPHEFFCSLYPTSCPWFL